MKQMLTMFIKIAIVMAAIGAMIAMIEYAPVMVSLLGLAVSYAVVLYVLCGKREENKK